ncbi:DUF4190 domain-containing protein [Streptomyces sp. NPDC005899]|uniref:DUF4190 domain-containing protein n=1 Tax=Streptomyces sp. NPDC005899 TaxID=3155716 RepID=UPI0033DA48FF
MTNYSGSPMATSRSGTNGLAVASLVCGIVGLFFFNVVLGPVAIVLGAVALRQVAAKGGAGLAKAGLILGIVDVVLFIVLMLVAASSGGFSWYVGG